jgi:hypothetical protein
MLSLSVCRTTRETMASTAPTVVRGESCWTDEYLLAHCENFRVDTEAGEHVGLVDHVMWSDDGFEAQALVVSAACRSRPAIVVPLRYVTELHPEGEWIAVSPEALADPARQRRQTS